MVSSKEVQINGVDANNLNLIIFNLLKQGLNPAKICFKLNIQKSSLQYYLSRLKKAGLIKKIGYGVWECVQKSEKEVQIIFAKSVCNTLNDTMNLNLLKGVPAFKKLLRKNDKFFCVFCGNKKEVHVHHLVPRGMRGSNSFNNLIPLCEEHHRFIHLNGMNDLMKDKVVRFHDSIGEDVFASVKNNIRGHGFVYTLKIPKFANWSKREDFLKKEGVDYISSKIANGKGQRIIINNFKVWLFQKRIIIYAPKGKSYFKKSAYESRYYALHECFEVIDKLESIFKLSLRYDGKYHVKVVKQHYADIKNELSQQYDDDKKKLYLFDERGLWLIIDNSLNLHELETCHKDSGVKDMDEVIKPFFNSLKDKPFTAYDFEKLFVLTSKAVENQDRYAENIELHLKAIQEMRDTLKEIKDIKKKS